MSDVLTRECVTSPGRRQVSTIRSASIMEDEIIDFYGSLQNLQEELGERFWRCHRGCLVNIHRVSRIFVKTGEIELVEIKLDNRERCVMSRRARLDIPEEFQ